MMDQQGFRSGSAPILPSRPSLVLFSLPKKWSGLGKGGDVSMQGRALRCQHFMLNNKVVPNSSVPFWEQ